MYIILFYWYLPYHHYIILKIETDYHSLREGISAGCFSSSCTSALIDKYIKDNVSNKVDHHILVVPMTIIRSSSIIDDTIRLFISTLKLRGELTSMTSWSSSSSST